MTENAGLCLPHALPHVFHSLILSLFKYKQAPEMLTDVIFYFACVSPITQSVLLHFVSLDTKERIKYTAVGCMCLC